MKLNKSQTADTVTAKVEAIVAEHSAMFKANKAEVFSKLLTTALYDLIGPKTGGGVVDKVKDDTVYCNYFGTYFPKEEFKTKTNGKFKANCITADKILRKIKNLRAAVTRGLTSELRAGRITQEQWHEAMNGLDTYTSQKFTDVSEIKWNDVEVSDTDDNTEEAE